jgi:signal transduction histidine kinase
MDMLERAQDANEQALAELRGVVRSILPPVLAERSLPDALTSLAAACPVTCRVDASLPARYAASVEATAYYVVAEALTNIARHSGARDAAVWLGHRDSLLRVEITDDGRGGADPGRGSGLRGIRNRVEALDGTFALSDRMPADEAAKPRPAGLGGSPR